MELSFFVNVRERFASLSTCFGDLLLVVTVIALAVVDCCIGVLDRVRSQFLLLLQLLLQLRLLSVAIAIIVEVAVAVIVLSLIVAYPQSFLWLVFGCPCSHCRRCSCGSGQSIAVVVVVAFWSLFLLAVFGGCPCGRCCGWLLYLPLRALLKLHHLPLWLWLLSVALAVVVRLRLYFAVIVCLRSLSRL